MKLSNNFNQRLFNLPLSEEWTPKAIRTVLLYALQSDVTAGFTWVL